MAVHEIGEYDLPADLAFDMFGDEWEQDRRVWIAVFRSVLRCPALVYVEIDDSPSHGARFEITADGIAVKEQIGFLCGAPIPRHEASALNAPRKLALEVTLRNCVWCAMSRSLPHLTSLCVAGITVHWGKVAAVLLPLLRNNCSIRALSINFEVGSVPKDDEMRAFAALFGAGRALRKFDVAGSQTYSLLLTPLHSFPNCL